MGGGGPDGFPFKREGGAGLEGGLSKGEAYNNGYLAGMREAARFNTDQNRRGNNKNPYNKLSKQFDTGSDLEDDNLPIERLSRNQPRSLRVDPIPMRKNRANTVINERENLLEMNSRMDNTERVITKQSGDQQKMPTQIFDMNDNGLGNKFFDKSKIEPINNFRTKDGKNFDEEVELRRQRYIRNQTSVNNEL